LIQDFEQAATDRRTSAGVEGVSGPARKPKRGTVKTLEQILEVQDFLKRN
jgi:hypothetical protein